VGADRKGPLAAFVVVALIAAILLVTSVRSQAAPWFSARIAAGPATEPHLWGSVTGEVRQVVRDGTVLVRKAVQTSMKDPTRSDAVSASDAVVTPRQRESVTATHQTRTHRTHLASRRRPRPPTRASLPGPGRHLGWRQHHGPDRSESPADSGEASAPADSHERAHGHAHGHGLGHGFGHGSGHGNSRYRR
jgi:hypothetical protein